MSPVEGTVTLLLTDVEGSTPRWEQAPEAMAADMAAHGQIFAVVVGGGGERPVEQGEGDSVVAVFTRASQAVAAALEAQRRLAGAVPGLRARMAIHTGEIAARDGRYDGPVIIRCARLGACAHGGQVLLPDALVAAERSGDTWATSRLTVQMGTLLAVGPDTLDGLDLIDRAAAQAEDAGDVGGLIQALGIVAVLAGAVNRTRRARTCLAAMERHDLTGYLHGYLLAQARAIEAGLSGRHAEAVATVEAALPDAPPAPRTGLLLMLGAQAASLGDRALADRAVALLPPRHERGLWDPAVAGLMANQALLHGDLEGVVHGVRAAHDAGFGRGPETITSGPAATMAALVGAYDVAEHILAGLPFVPGPDDLTWKLEGGTPRALVALGRDDPGEAEREALLVLDDARREGQVPRVVGLLEIVACTPADPDRGVRLAAAAARVRAETGFALRSPAVEAALTAAGERAAAVLGERLAAVEAEGAALGWDGAAAYALRGRGERRRPAHGWDSLTPTESAVVDLVAEGLGNARIAERLLVEVSTVKTHLHHVFRKLGVTTRAQLAAAATGRRNGQAS
jgi:DNA-binding CsgD family transcriptional regulator